MDSFIILRRSRQGNFLSKYFTCETKERDVYAIIESLPTVSITRRANEERKLPAKYFTGEIQCRGKRDIIKDFAFVSITKLPFKLIVATAWVANSNVDLFIRGHKRGSLR